MGVIALMAVLVYFGPGLAAILIIIIAAASGRPRKRGRLAYAIAIVPLLLLSAGIFEYFRTSKNLNASVIPPFYLFILMLTAAGAAVGCVLATALYDVARPSS